MGKISCPCYNSRHVCLIVASAELLLSLVGIGYLSDFAGDRELIGRIMLTAAGSSLLKEVVMRKALVPRFVSI